MNTNDKLLVFNELDLFISKQKSLGNKIVHCHGTFDLVHPGHVIHFEEAKNLGDILIVTITSDEFVNKGPGRPFFNNQLRIKSVASLSIVDWVVIIPYPTAVEAIKCVKPDIYCKGIEYIKDENDVTGNIQDDRRVVEEVGGKIAYVGSTIFSSTRLLNNHFNAQSPQIHNYCRKVCEQYNSKEFLEIIEQFKNLNVLVLGDIIFDKYTSVSVQGLTSKNRILSSRFLSEQTQPGGALAVYRHIKEFTKNVKLASILGTEKWLDIELSKYLHPNDNAIVYSSKFTSIIKQRFIEPQSHDNEINKIFSVNYIDDGLTDEDVLVLLLDKISKLIVSADLVLVMDFGHGVMKKIVRDYVQENAKFLALNCQTNSNNYGFNIINRQYRKVDSLSLDQTEISLAVGKRSMNFANEMQQLQDNMGAKYGWLTRGGAETIGTMKGENPVFCPSLETNIVDTIGAGDAFCSLASLTAVLGLPLFTSTFIGQLAGAQAVRIVGNSLPIQKQKFLKAAESLLNF